MDAASIEEINKVRRSMGMKPLPVPGAAPPPKEATPEKAADDDGEVASNLDTREAASYGNYQKALEADAAKRAREQKAAAIKKAREMAQRNAVLAGKGLADDDDDDLDAKSWLKSQKKKQKKIEAARKAEEEKAAAEAAAAREHTAADLAGVKVAHDMESLLGGEDQVLTLKDMGVLENEEEGDELENLALREDEKLRERLDLKKKKPLYDPNDVDETIEHGILSQYDEEIYGKKKKTFTLGNVTSSTELADILEAPAQRRRQAVSLDTLEDAPAPVSDYLDPSEIKVKKLKKKKTKSTRQRRGADDDDVLFAEEPTAGNEAPPDEMEVDSAAATIPKKRKVIDDNFVDDDDLQSSLALQRRDALKKRKKTRPEDIAKQLREQAARSPSPGSDEPKGVVLDEISEFVDGLRAHQEEEEPRAKPKAKEAAAPVTAMEEDSDSEDEAMHDAPPSRSVSPSLAAPAGVEEEKTINQGMGATLALLRERNLIDEGKGAELNEKQRQHQRFLAERDRRMALFDEETRVQREIERASGRFERMSNAEQQKYREQQNTRRQQQLSKIMDDLYREGYRPNVELRYFDGDGRSLDAKEAFKELSHQFHGKGSGKGKTDKRLKKLAEEKRRMAQSMLDAGQIVGMNSAATHQGKKRREAGVRLA